MILFTFKFNHLAALAVMLVCPVCKNHHQEKVEQCQRCNWSMQDDVGISLDHKILTTCIPTLIEHLEKKQKAKNDLLSHIQVLDPDIHRKNNRKLDEIQEKFEKDREETNKQFSNLEKIINELKFILNNKSNLDNISSSTVEIDSPKPNQTRKKNIKIETVDNSIEKSGLQINNGSNLIDESSGDRESVKTINSSENSEPETNSDDSCLDFYSLIKCEKLEVNKVTVTQETMEKLRGGTQSELKFTNDRKGNYWIYNWQDVYYLIPKEKLYINPYQYGNFQRVFNCQDYQETYKDFEVIEPATVVKSNREIWQLKNKGQIKFI